ncbi:MAG TPA: SAM-dependent methyltransferase, partial [Ruania sp.]|nr:SAM-dependent methyltransferase [Ruania sp.]
MSAPGPSDPPAADQYAVGPAEQVRHRPAGQAESVAASRFWWDAEAADYVAEHRTILGDACLMWGPEGVYEAELGLLGPLVGRDVLEFGAGAAQGSRWCAAQGARVVASDLSASMLGQGRALDRDLADRPSAYVQCDAA